MSTMKSVQTGEQNRIDVVDIERPVPGPKDALARLRHLRHRRQPPHGRHTFRPRRVDDLAARYK